MTQIPIALQLYTVRDEAEIDLLGTLQQVAEIGYTNVQLAGLYGRSSSELKKIFTDLELKPIAAHVGIDSLDSQAIGQTLQNYLDLGVFSVVIPWLSADGGFAKNAERLNAIGETVRRFGTRLYYHNHDFEFTTFEDGQPGIEVLIQNTDPSLVSFELDTYWVLFGGHDPVEFIKKHGTRISLLHIKDMDPGDRSFAPIGTGLLPIDEIVKAALEADIDYLVVEQDTTKGPSIDAVRTSLNNLRSKGYA